jgi:ubiquinone/menaquinone biosynthesis C-methylase UbiE
MMSQNVWDLKGLLLERQKRRAQIVTRSLRNNPAGRVLDIGCAEGYATSFISEIARDIVGVELDLQMLKIAHSKVRKAHFVNASITHLPFRSDCFDAVCILEVLEHLQTEKQQDGLQEADRVLHRNGSLLISVPYKETITFTRCIHCNNPTPLFGHLHSMDEDILASLLPPNFRPVEKFHLPNLERISCLTVFRSLPLTLWILANEFLGLLSKGYWLVTKYSKN